MAIVSSHELSRKGEWELGQPIKLTREFVVVLSDNTLENNPTQENQIFIHLGIDIGTPHPTYVNNCVRKMTFTEGYEGSPYHVHVLFEYGPVLANEMIHPTSRTYVWEAESTIGEIAATTFWDGNQRRPLTNSAYDFYPGLTTGEGMATLRVTANFSNWPSAWFAATNCVNNALYAGCEAGSLKVTSVRCTQQTEQFGANAVAFWQAVAELQYRETGHGYRLPDIGWNYLAGGQKRRAMVFAFETNEWVPSPNPIGLDGAGNPSPTGWPYIWNRRMNPEVNFQSLFDTFPTVPLQLLP